MMITRKKVLIKSKKKLVKNEKLVQNKFTKIKIKKVYAKDKKK